MKTKAGRDLTGAELLAYYRQRGYEPSAFGPADVAYAMILQDMFALRGRRVLDAGCGGGRHLRGFCDVGLDAYGIEPEACFVADHVPGLDGRILLWPPNEPAFPPRTFGFIHSSQVLEHVAEADVPRHLWAMRFMLAPGGVFFASLIIGPHPGDVPGDDDTHVNYKPLAWWIAAATAAGFADETELWTRRLRANDWIAAHNWDFLVLKNP